MPPRLRIAPHEIADPAWIRGGGIAVGELTAVVSIVQARLQGLCVDYLDYTVSGQRLAEFDREVIIEAVAQQLQLTNAPCVSNDPGSEAVMPTG